MQLLSYLNPLSNSEGDEEARVGGKRRPERRRPNNALHDAALWNDVGKVKMYLKSGASDANDFATGTQQTALMWAAQEGHIETCQILIEFGAKAGAKDENGRTALDIARRQGHEAVAEMIADAEARQKRRAQKARQIQRSRAEAQERAKADASTRLNSFESAVRVTLWLVVATLLLTGLHTWISPQSGLELYGYKPSGADRTNMPLVALNGMGRIVLGVSLLQPQFSVGALVTGMVAWLPNYATLEMPPFGGLAALLLVLSALHLLSFVSIPQPWWPTVQQGAKALLHIALFLSGAIGYYFPSFAASCIQIGVPLTRLGTTQLASFSVLALVGVSLWITVDALDRSRTGAMSAGFAAVCVAAVLYQELALKFYLDDPVRVSSNSDVYDARGFVAALLLFGALVALVVAGFFALGVRLHKSKTFWLGVLKKGWSSTKRGWRRLKLFVEGVKTRASGKQDSAIILN